MKVEDLISKLELFQKGTNVYLFDWRKNLHHEYGDGNSEGVYSEFSIELEKLESDEAEYYQERNDKEFIPWISISFENEDYNDDGQCLI